MEKLMELGLRMGLEGESLRNFVLEQQALEREERAKEREREREQRQYEEREREYEEIRAMERAKEREHEKEMKMLELEILSKDGSQSNSVSKSNTRSPKLPPFVDHKDDLDSYLNRFERFAKSNNWDKTTWSISLSALLTGRALDVYSRLSEESAADYEVLKEALLKRYDLTENGFRDRFRSSKPEQGESPEQFVTRLRNYLSRWIELSDINKDYESLCDLFIKEQFIASCPSDLAIYLKERAPRDLNDLSKLADQYLLAHDKCLSSRKQENKIPTSNRNFKQNYNDRPAYKQKTFNSKPGEWHSTVNCYSSNASHKPNPKCAFCLLPHKSEDCRKIQSMDVKTRKEKIKQAKACFLCLKTGSHVAKDCYSGKSCENCSKRHHVLICEENNKLTVNLNEAATTSASLMATHRPTSKVLLMTASVLVEGATGEKKEARLLIDGGSQRSYIRTSLANSIKAKTVSSETLQIQSFGEHSSSCVLNLVNVKITSRVDTYSGSFKLLSMSQLCSPLETVPLGPWISELEERGFTLADEVQTTSCGRKPIDIIIGADQMWKIFTSNTFSTSYGIVASETKFGWVLQGPISHQYCTNASTKTNVLFSIDVSKFWDLETVGISNDEPDISPTLEKFNAQIEREEDGRYKVPLLWKDTDKNVEPNLDVAKHRLKCLNSRLNKNPDLKKNYSQVFDDYESMDIIEKVPESELQKTHDVFYLPHHAIVREQSKTTKVRPVFDGSAKDKNGNSLNDLLDPGPSLLPHLIDLLLRFRLYAIAFTGDIAKAFLQLLLKEDDRDFVRFLWNENTYRFKRVCFGITCAPFLLNAIIRYHLKSFGKQITDKMIDSFYVDDLVMGSVSLENSVSEIMESIAIMKKACMSLTKWTTSSQSLAQKLKTDFNLNVQHEGITKILGVLWNLDTDELELEIPHWDMNNICTKRTILSYAAKIFDPFGFAAPIVLSLKLFIKHLWTKGYDWDIMLSEEDCECYQSLMKSFSDLDKLTVPRFYNFHSKETCYALHLFCDSSEQAYAACIYIQSCSDGQLKSTFVIAKTRLAPVKRITLPRLELLACFIGAKLVKKVMDAVNFPSSMKLFCWSDSTIAISWIRSSASKYKQFVSNRVQLIQSLTSPSSWNYCPGTQNPADHATRAVSSMKWNKSVWFHGPTWLNYPSEWPRTTFRENLNLEDEDIHQENKAKDSKMFHSSTEIFFDVARFNSLKSMVRVYALVLKAVMIFKRLIHKDVTNQVKTPYEEYENSKAHLIRKEQEKFFSAEINSLKKGEKIPVNSVLRNLRLALEDGYLVSVGRIDFDKLIILPHNSHLTKLLILDAHRLLCHGGISVTLTDLRSRFWIIKGRRTVRSALRSCSECTLYSAQPYSQEEAPLMDYRLKKRKAFEITGCDYSGPFYPKEGGKVYLLIFTCTVIRAVHLEMCQSINTEDFLLAFRRFQARFGTPNIMISDNGKSFKSAKVILQDTLEWRFIPEYSPSWGGLWERLIRSIKSSLRKILGAQRVSLEVLRTVLYEIESGINKRPLTYLSEDREDLLPLRPIDFISGPTLMAVSQQDDATMMRKTFKVKTHILDQLWKRWTSEYLIELRSWNKKKNKVKTSPKVGDIVLVNPKKFASKNRALWPLGRIIKLFFGKDGFPRCAVVLSQGSTSRQNTGNLYPLEVNSGD